MRGFGAAAISARRKHSPREHPGGARIIRASGWLYLEAPRPWPDSAWPALGLVLHRYLKAGAVYAHSLVKSGHAQGPESDTVR